MKYTPNRDPAYYSEANNQVLTNCGSLALNIEEWYSPDEEFEMDDLDMAVVLSDEGESDDEILNFLFERNVEKILEDFVVDFDIHRVDSKDYPLKPNEELIAFRQCFNRTFYDENVVVDYHFRVKRNGKWIEKMGAGPVKPVEDYNEEPWMASEELIYSGPIAYFVKKIN